MTPGTTYTFSFSARNHGGLAASYSVYDASHRVDIVPATSYLSRIDGTTWTRVTQTFVAPAGCSSVTVYPLRNSLGAVDILLWRAKLELGSSATN